MRAAHQRGRDTHGAPEVIKAGELIESTFTGGTTLSGSARKLLILLLHAAGGQAGDDVEHEVRKASLRGRHESNDRISAGLDELQRCLLKLRTKSPSGQNAIVVSPIISRRIEDIGDDARATVWFRFSPELREIISASNYYASMQRETVLALASRYSVTMFELGSLLHGREHPVWRGSVEQLREQFGVPAGRLPRWVDLRRYVLEPSTREVNALAFWQVGWTVSRRRGAVAEIELRFWPREDKNA